MNGINLILIFLAILGFLPLAIVLYKRNLVKKILTTGVATQATIFHIFTTHRTPQDIVQYVFHDQYSGRQYQGTLITKVGAYKKGDTLSIHYLKENPKRNTMEGAWKSNVFLWFTVALALFVLFVVFRLYQEIQSGNI